MSKHISLPKLDQPCDVPWDAMAGDERSRFCDRCGIHVHNLSARPPDEAAALLKRRGRTTCFAVQQAPVALDYAPAPKRSTRWVAAMSVAASALVTAGCSVFIGSQASGRGAVLAGAIRMPTVIPFDPVTSPPPTDSAGRAAVQSLIDCDGNAGKFNAALPEPFELADLRHNVHPAGMTADYGTAYVVADADGSVVATYWLLSGAPQAGGPPLAQIDVPVELVPTHATTGYSLWRTGDPTHDDLAVSVFAPQSPATRQADPAPSGRSARP